MCLVALLTLSLDGRKNSTVSIFHSHKIVITNLFSVHYLIKTQSSSNTHPDDDSLFYYTYILNEYRKDFLL